MHGTNHPSIITCQEPAAGQGHAHLFSVTLEEQGASRDQSKPFAILFDVVFPPWGLKHSREKMLRRIVHCVFKNQAGKQDANVCIVSTVNSAFYAFLVPYSSSLRL